MYSEKILDHFQNPRNAGHLPEADATVIVKNPVCGDVFELAISVDQNHVTQARFLAKGCVPLIACASMVAEMIEGKSIDTLRDFNIREFLQDAGPLPQASLHAGDMVVRAARDLALKIEERTPQTVSKEEPQGNYDNAI